MQQQVVDNPFWQDRFLSILEALVTRESPSGSKDELDRLAEFIKGQFQKRGCSAETIPMTDTGNHLKVKWIPGNGDTHLAPLLVLCHMDTVWDVGTLHAMPFRIDGDQVWGPGTLDMKAGIAMALVAMDILIQRGLSPRRPVTFLVNSDEEIGSPSSRPLIEAEAQRSEYVIVLEGAQPGSGACKTSRKGVGMFRLEIKGKAAHAGLAPQDGISAIEELARQVIKLHSYSDFTLGTSVNVGVVQGGTRRNVVADHAEALIDLRVTSQQEAERMEKLILALQPELQGAEIHLSGGINRPPMERTTGNIQLYQKAKALAHSLGLSLPEDSSGGGSDGNFTSALGIPTLDGMGAVGYGPHATNEHILLTSTFERIALLTELFLHL
ncbi:MAG: M20 family metallopeptidase [Firmicutes bacterium]|jgi:glutamate carboxypeptidase|nr:M20 family metallopeptidase [Bacillota bacterium]